jgi:hypothetical protein
LFHSSTSTLIRLTLSLEYQLSNNSLSSTFNSYFLALSCSAAFLAASSSCNHFNSNSSALSSGDKLSNLLASASASAAAVFAASFSVFFLSSSSFLFSQSLNLGVTLAVCSHISSGLRYFSI